MPANINNDILEYLRLKIIGLSTSFTESNVHIRYMDEYFNIYGNEDTVLTALPVAIVAVTQPETYEMSNDGDYNKHIKTDSEGNSQEYEELATATFKVEIEFIAHRDDIYDLKNAFLASFPKDEIYEYSIVITDDETEAVIRSNNYQIEFKQCDVISKSTEIAEVACSCAIQLDFKYSIFNIHNITLGELKKVTLNNDDKTYVIE